MTYQEIEEKISNLRAMVQTQLDLINGLEKSLILKKYSDENNHCLERDGKYIISTKLLLDLGFDLELFNAIYHNNNIIYNFYIGSNIIKEYNKINKILPGYFKNTDELIKFIQKH